MEQTILKFRNIKHRRKHSLPGSSLLSLSPPISLIPMQGELKERSDTNNDKCKPGSAERDSISINKIGTDKGNILSYPRSKSMTKDAKLLW